ncbi:general substrate transporter [Armillaria borealis]|uniref:General substrate transporter n=1 Tax=Armillaria borealis TaxID=47425 RepID=A0AA39JR24_9AGAR|nr:general substrate transporter [Armillaria borealis]
MAWKDELAVISRYRNAYVLALSGAMGSIFYGWDIGLIGGVLSLASFQEYFGLDKASASVKADLSGNIVSVLQGGCFFGALAMGYFSGRFGRKPCLIASGIIYLIGSLIQSIVGLGSSQKISLRVLYFSRFVGGVGVGMVSALVPAYISECTPRAIRGRFWVNYSASKDIPHGEMQWRVPFIVQMVPGVLFTIAMLFQPESPRWLVEHQQYDRAARTLAFVARTSVEDETVQATLAEIKSDFEGKQKLPLLNQFVLMGESRSIALRCFIPSLVMFFQQWTGTNAINYFSPQIFASLGISGTTSGLFATGTSTTCTGCCVVAVAIVLAFAVEGMGRKRCLIIGGIGQAATMLWIGGYSAIHTSGTVVPASYVSIVAVYLYAVAYCIGFGPLPWVVAGEVAPNHLRTVALSLAISVNWLFSFTISKLTPIMLNEITYGTFLLFGLCCVIMTIWAYVFLPETSGYALEDIKYLFEKDVILRSLQDAPGGTVFLRGKRAVPVEELIAQDAHRSLYIDDGDVLRKSPEDEITVEPRA